MGVLGHYDSFWTTFPKIKEKNINLRKNKNKKFIFFIGQEIKKPDLSGQNRSNPQNPQNPQKSGQNRTNPVKSGNPSKDIDLGKFPKLKQFFDPEFSSQKIFHFLKDFHSLTPAGVPFPLEQSLILNKSRSQALCSQCLSAHLRG